jgi:hypothetical protein
MNSVKLTWNVDPNDLEGMVRKAAVDLVVKNAQKKLTAAGLLVKVIARTGPDGKPGMKVLGPQDQVRKAAEILGLK